MDPGTPATGRSQHLQACFPVCWTCPSYADFVLLLVVLVLAGNKADLEAQRQVTKEAAQALAEEVSPVSQERPVQR